MTLKHGDISPAIAAYSVVKMLKPLQMWRPFLAAKDVPCSRCSAVAGEPCRTASGTTAGNSHGIRVEDAHLATQAARAMAPEPEYPINSLYVDDRDDTWIIPVKGPEAIKPMIVK